MARKKAEGEQKMSHALEELQRDKALLQRDLATARWEMQLASHDAYRYSGTTWPDYSCVVLA